LFAAGFRENRRTSRDFAAWTAELGLAIRLLKYVALFCSFTWCDDPSFGR